MKLTDRQIQNRLNKAAALFNEVAAALTERYGPDSGAFIYVESEGQFHAMRKGPKGGDGSDQADIIVSSKHCRFDCGAW